MCIHSGRWGPQLFLHVRGCFQFVLHASLNIPHYGAMGHSACCSRLLFTCVLATKWCSFAKSQTALPNLDAHAPHAQVCLPWLDMPPEPQLEAFVKQHNLGPADPRASMSAVSPLTIHILNVCQGAVLAGRAVRVRPFRPVGLRAPNPVPNITVPVWYPSNGFSARDKQARCLGQI